MVEIPCWHLIGPLKNAIVRMSLFGMIASFQKSTGRGGGTP